MRTLVIALFCGSIFALASHSMTHAAEPGKPKAKSFKGWELYAQFDAKKNEWRFGLLHGTNRLKTGKEIADAITLAGIKPLQKELSRLEEGESVFLQNRLPKSIRKEIQDHCTQEKLKFVDAAR